MLAASLFARTARSDQTVTISTTDTGGLFEGVGAVSGGGGTSVLLRDYVEPQRTQLLDYLFKPHFGAGMQELYVEIGGDGNSTQGSEPSHERSATDKNFDRGYEWWLMEQARARNPNIQLDATAWSAPAWVGGGNFYSQGTATYLADFVAGAKSAHGLDLNYVGCRNERGIYETFLELIRGSLDGAGMTSVGVHGFDNPPYSGAWNWVLDLSTNPTLASDVYAIGQHTTWGDAGAPPDDIKAAARAAGKPIWDTEEHVYEHGFQCEMDIVRAYLQNYIESRIAKTIYWYLITAFYSVEPYYDLTVGVASSPWSGAFTINPALWAYAHITQFADPGWQFADSASGALAAGGDFVTLLSPSKTDFSVVADTWSAATTQSVTFILSGLVDATQVSVWRSDAVGQFVRQPSVPISNGSFAVPMEANAIYSITTTTGQTKGAAAPPPPATAFPFPYYETYDHYADLAAVGYRPYYHADISGTFELAPRPDNTGMCLHQVVAQRAQSWAPEPSGPYTIVGDSAWRNYEVSVDTMLETAGWTSLMGRIQSVGNGFGTGFKAYYLTLDNTGMWGFYSGTGADSTNSTELSIALATGHATLAATSWHNMKLVFSGTSIEGRIDGGSVFSITDATFAFGQVGVGTQNRGGGLYTTAYFDNLIVNAVGGATPSPSIFVQDGQRDAGLAAPDAAVVPPPGGAVDEPDAGASRPSDPGAGNAVRGADAGVAASPQPSPGCSCRTEGGASGAATAWTGLVAVILALGASSSRRLHRKRLDRLRSVREATEQPPRAYSDRPRDNAI